MDTTEDLPVTRANVEAAYAIINPHVRKTPVVKVKAEELGLDPALRPISLKLEYLQHTGSFKARGAMNNILTNQIPEAGVVAASGGNHGAALAFAAQKKGVPCTVFVFDYTPETKVERIRSFGADVRPIEGGFDVLMETTSAFAEETGGLLVHPYDSLRTIAGQGTTAIEFMEQSEPDTFLVATGGGGLIGGIAAYIEDRAKIISVEPETAPTLFDARAAGKPVQSKAGGIAADSLGPGQVGELMFPITQAYVEDAILVPDRAIRGAWEYLWKQFRIVVEPGGAVALAALISGAYKPEKREYVGVVLCGANTNVVSFPK